MAALVFFICIVLPFYLMLWILANTGSIESDEPNLEIGISLIIPFRNEENNLPDLINCLGNLQLNDNDEVILVDDQSENSSASRLQGFPSALG